MRRRKPCWFLVTEIAWNLSIFIDKQCNFEKLKGKLSGVLLIKRKLIVSKQAQSLRGGMTMQRVRETEGSQRIWSKMIFENLSNVVKFSLSQSDFLCPYLFLVSFLTSLGVIWRCFSWTHETNQIKHEKKLNSFWTQSQLSWASLFYPVKGSIPLGPSTI